MPLRRYLLLSIALLFIADTLRVIHSTYGYDAICLTPPDEYWLYDTEQVSSSYAWDITPRTEFTLDAIQQAERYPRARTALVTPDALLTARLAGSLVGLLVVALTLALARRLRTNWSWLAGLFVATAPWFVNTDRWVIRFDLATLAAGVSVTALYYSRHTFSRAWLAPFTRGIQVVSALSLLLLAPPLWWVAIGLLLLQPRPHWKLVILIAAGMVLAIPALRSPIHWYRAATSWDLGATAACVWLLLALALWRFRQLAALHRAILAIAIAASGTISLLSVLSLPRPDAREWQLIDWLQQRIPDGTLVRFDPTTWHLASIVACPVGAHIQFTAQPEPPSIPSLPGDREYRSPDYIVTTNADQVGSSPYVYDVGNGYYVGQAFVLPNPTDLQFGNLLHILSYELSARQYAPGDRVNVRLDYQFAAEVSTDTLNDAIFFHVTLPGQPGEKRVDYNVPLIERTDTLVPRKLILNEHYRIPLPESIPAGHYDVLFGIYNVYTGERLAWSEGDSLLIGQIDVIR